MSKVLRKKRKLEKTERKELELLDKSELIDKILRLEANNEQLKTAIDRFSNEETTKKDNARKLRKPFDFAKCYKRHILLKFYYLGWDYNGFVLQENTESTVERQVFAALTKSCCIQSRESSNYHRCGRTDKGVSSFSQVISLDIRSRLKPEEQDKLDEELPYCKILNRLLPSNIRCIAWSPVPDDFSARFDCKFRTYKYFFPRGSLDVAAMDKAVKYAIGDHDFRNICKMDVGNGVINFKRTVADAKVSVRSRSSEKDSGYDMCELVITSQAFLWHQIRCLMGVLLLVGQGNEKPEIIRDLLDVDRYPRKPQYNLAHEIPLNLWYCEYENKEWFIDREELINTIKILQKDWTINTIKSVMIENMLSVLESSVNGTKLSFQSDCLLLGVQSKVYRPLMERMTCESLEYKIRHYERKGKFEIVRSDDAEDFVE